MPRSNRFGALLDLVYYPRPANSGGAFLLDRFEATSADLSAWLASLPDGDPARQIMRRWNQGTEPELPAVGLDLLTARRWADWRFGRLPRADEWRFAASAGGRHVLPWGDAPRGSWANAIEFGLGRLAPVGAFESGGVANGPYDLVGNAAEWTETPSPAWLEPRLELQRELVELTAIRSLRATALRVADNFGMAVWRGLPIPLLPLLADASPTLPRLVAHGLDAGLPRARPGSAAEVVTTDVTLHLPQDRSSLLGMRLATDPETLIEAWLDPDLTLDPSEAELAALRSFCRRSEIRPALTVAYLARRSRTDDSSTTAISRWLATEFAP
ncbi:MAG: formylglycine-generating enzyme family protein [Planctomycetota bacterium]